MKFKAALTTTIYKKSLLLSSTGRKDFTTGEIVNLMSIDVQRIIDYILWCNLVWSSLVQIIISIVLIWQQLGLATIAGVATMIIMMFPNGIISNQFKVQQSKQMINKDQRAKTLTEALAGIKVLKVYSWTKAFIAKISSYRNEEIKCLRTIVICFSIIVFLFNMAPFFVSMASFLTYVFVYTDFVDRLDANKIFVSLSLFNIIRIPLGLIPFLISNGIMAFVSIKRINKYLSGDELEEDTKIDKVKDKAFPVKMQNASFAWDDDTNECTLKDISFKVKKRSLVAIVGQVGAGKSSLFSALLGEMKKASGKSMVSDSIAYIPQIAWIMNKTVKENILFGEPYDRRKYEDLIDRAQLRDDLKILSAGDETEIGEKGINLSGGQKQRINVARAVYSDKSIYLFDDPLSALDSNVGKEIFDKIISNDGILKNKTRLLVTHRLSLMKRVDHIIVMKDGRISEQGSYSDLMDRKGDLANLILEFLADTHNNDTGEIPEELLNDIKEKLPGELERSRSFMQKTGNVDSSMKSIESSKGVSTSIYQQSGKKQLERSGSILSRSSIQLEKDKTIEKKLKQESLKLKQKKKGKLIEVEHMETGSVSKKVYWNYIKALNLNMYLIAVVSYLISHTFNVFSQLWLSKWSDDSIDPRNFNNTALRNKRLVGYAGFGIGEMVFVFVATIILSIACLNAAKKIHNSMLLTVFASPMSWFDTVPMGRVVNRFTKDIDTADFGINMAVRGVLVYNFRALVSFTLISIQTSWFLIALIPIAIIYIIVQTFYIATSRQLKRLESTTRSPIFSHFSETVQGASSIRAYQVKDRFLDECCEKVDFNHKIYYPNICAVRWLTVRLEFLGYFIVFLSSLFAIVFRDTLTPGLVGVSITSALTITNTLNNLIKSFSDLETNIVSIERCLEYTKLDSERPDEIPENKPKNDWPDKGVIKFIDYSTKYRPDLDLVLNKLNFTINQGEKVGIVGRTGAGKSTITLTLFRIIESVSGKILIDDIDISKIGLNDLRSRLSIIPQDPVLFTGSIRFNLDPYGAHSDEEIWKAIEQAHLKQFVVNQDGGLDYLIAEGGDNLSIGQRQLICLARALLRKSRILVLDEATASVDLETDDLIQKTIRDQFNDCTICTIAHRLNTILDYDKVLVLDYGKVAEFASPQELLKSNTIFYSMAEKSGLV